MKKLALAALLPAMLGGCASATSLPAVLPFTSPMNADLGLLRTANPSGISGYTPRQVTDPKSWRELNEMQSPESKGSS